MRVEPTIDEQLTVLQRLLDSHGTSEELSKYQKIRDPIYCIHELKKAGWDIRYGDPYGLDPDMRNPKFYIPHQSRG